MTTSIGRQRLVLTAVGGHLLLTVLHGVVHAAVPVVPTARKAWVATIVLYLVPATAAGLTGRGHRRVGGVLLFGAGLAGLAFEGVWHFLVANPDHVAHVADHRVAFGLTALLSTASNLLLLGAGWFANRSARRLADDGSVIIGG